MRAWRLVLVTLAGCATTPATPAAPSSAPGDDARALAVVLAGTRTVAPESALLATPRAPVFGAAKGDIRDVYRKVAPATVLIRAGGGFGTGIVINAKGFILTNHHVIAHADAVDFRRRVTVERGRLGAGGVMELDPTPLTAWVLKSDPLVDLAILKLDDPPKDLHAVKVAARDPVPGEPVSALGNGGIGLLWAIKDGEVSSIGKLATHLAQLVAAQCQASMSDDATSAEACRTANASAELQKELIEKQVPGLVIQTSCTISPGDSGGPLVNRAGELVGVNAFLRSDTRAPVTSNFHVHVAEVRKFLKEVPTEAPAIVPDPLQLVRFGRWVDSDGDGRSDLYVAGRPGKADLMVRLQGIGGGLDPDLAVATVEGRRIAWYDVDDDGRFDRVVVGAKDDAPARAWSLKPGLELGAFLGAAKVLDAAAFPGERGERMAGLEPALAQLLGLAPPPDPSALPAPSELALGAPVLRDTDRNGKYDAAVVSTLSGVRVVLDPAEQVLPAATPGSVAKALQKGEALTSAQIVTSSARTWGLVGSADHRLALSCAVDPEVVEDAFFVAPEGRGAAKPELFGAPLGKAMALHYQGDERARLAGAVAVTDGRAAPQQINSPFLDPLRDIGTDVLAEDSGVAGLEWAVVSVVGGRAAASALVFELDADALKGLSPEKREAAVKAAAPGTDFAWVGWGPWQWFSYDTDGDGAFDVVLISRGGKVEARRVAKDGTVTVDAALAAGKPVRPSLLVGARAEALKKLAPVFFQPADVEP